jgi:hypothetical protein
MENKEMIDRRAGLLFKLPVFMMTTNEMKNSIIQ